VPRAFSTTERELIEAKLLEVGLAEFTRHGLRRTNVAGLARAAGIAKGSFYLFFPSKEGLLLALITGARERTRERLGAIVEDPGLSPRDRIEAFVRAYLVSFARDPLRQRLRDPEESEAFRRSLPAGTPDPIAHDLDEYFVSVLEQWEDAGELTPLQPDALFGLARALRAVGLDHAAIGEERFERAVDVLVGALADSLAW
jgi:AcrR family transcriptional regulator